MYKTIVETAATSEPLSMNEVRHQLRLSAGDDDDHAEWLLSVARDKAEKYCNRFFTEQTVKIVFEGGMDSTKIDLPYPDLDSVASITYVDQDNARQTISSGDYTFLSDEQVIYSNSAFPTDAKSYTVTVNTAAPEEMGAAKAAIAMILTDLYELRTESVVGFSVATNPAVSNFLWPYRVNLGV